jgi:hypothetical protein
MVRIGEVEQRMANEAPAEFNEFIDLLSEHINEAIPQREDRDKMRQMLETLMFGLSRQWIGCRAVWPDEVPDTIEGIESL